MVREDLFEMVTYGLRPESWEQPSHPKVLETNIPGRGTKGSKIPEASRSLARWRNLRLTGLDRSEAGREPQISLKRPPGARSDKALQARTRSLHFILSTKGNHWENLHIVKFPRHDRIGVASVYSAYYPENFTPILLQISLCPNKSETVPLPSPLNTFFFGIGAPALSAPGWV